MGEGAIPSWAVKGARVVCIDADAKTGYHWAEDDEPPVKGTVYTIRRAFVNCVGEPALHLREISRGEMAIARYGQDSGYRIDRFRPLVTRSQEHDVAIFAPLLNAPHRQDEPA